MKIDFVKMHGLGNDFVMLDATCNEFNLSKEQIVALAQRHTGIGFDQLLIVEPAASTAVDFSYRIFNSDGNEVEQCGNGARCFAQYVRKIGLTDKHEIKVQTLAAIMHLKVLNEIDVEVDMGRAVFSPEDVPFLTEESSAPYRLKLTSADVEFEVVNIGNPHAVLFVDDVDAVDIQAIGAELEMHPAFPKRCNVQFVQVLGRDQIKQRIFERGAGETMASGSGACAAAAAAIQTERVNNQLRVSMPGGELSLSFDPDTQHILMTGPTAFSFSGSVEL